jgi:hypothetical protein
MLDIAIVACKLREESKPSRRRKNLIMFKVHTGENTLRVNHFSSLFTQKNDV